MHFVPFAVTQCDGEEIAVDLDSHDIIPGAEFAILYMRHQTVILRQRFLNLDSGIPGQSTATYPGSVHL